MPDHPRHKVEHLFRAAFDMPAPVHAACELVQEIEPEGIEPGQRLGAWSIVEEIGRGGMGAVYAAVRADRAFEKRVAIKVVKRGIDTDAVLDRFRHERSILASLDHPYIAGVLDAGTAPDGRPWFVMELIDGRPIDEYCREHELSVGERCRLFRKVCEAVAYAHRSLVIHRDLKPANILVTGDGVPKLLDFGIARLLSVQPAQSTLPCGEHLVSEMTPAYASPEQQRGEAVNTATDVYSLGAVLYEILSGQKPPVSRKPSQAAEEKPAQAQLAGDLDNIVLKACHPEQARRYASVDELSEDLNRYLTRLPVLAHGDEAAYRLRKFVARHLFGVVAAAVLVGCLSAGVIAMVWETHRAEIERQRAEQRLDQMVTLANHTLLDVHQSIEHTPGALEARKQIVSATMHYLDQLAKDSGDDPRLESALAAGYARVAELKGAPPGQPSLGDWMGAVDTYRRTAGLLDALLVRDPDNVPLLLRRAEVSREMGSALDAMQLPARSAEEFERGMRAANRALKREPANRQARELAARLREEAIGDAGDSSVENPWRELLKLLPGLEQLATDYPDDPDAIFPLGEANGILGAMMTHEQRNDEALAYARRSAVLLERVMALRPHDVVAQHTLAMQYSHMTYSLERSARARDREEAVDYARKALAITDALCAADPGSQVAAVDRASAYIRLASALPDSQSDEALRILDKASAVLEETIAAAPHFTRLYIALIGGYWLSGERLKHLHRYEAALLYYRKSLQSAEVFIARGPGTKTDLDAVEIEGRICEMLALLGERNELKMHVAGMIGRARKIVGTWPAAVAESLSWAGDAFAELPDRNQAADYYDRSMQEWARLPEIVRIQSRAEMEASKAAFSRARAGLTHDGR